MPQRSPAHQEMHDEHIAKLDAYLGATGLPTKQAKRYRAAAMRVLDRMTEAGMGRLKDNLTAYHFYPDPESLGEEAGGRNVAGFYRQRNGSIHLDGGDGDESIPRTYAHEYAHALDGPDSEISESPEWQAAWREEMADVPGMGRAGAASASEGWAELGERLLRGRDAMKCPKCVKIWEGLGL